MDDQANTARNLFDLDRGASLSSDGFFIRWSDWALRYGISGYDRETKKRLLIVNMAGYLSALSSISFIISFAVQDFMTFKWMILGNFISAVITTTAPYWHRVNSIASPIVLTTTTAIALFFFVSELGRDSGIHLNYIGAVAIAFVIFGLSHLRLIFFVITICIVGHVSCHFLFPTGRVQMSAGDPFIAQMYILSATTIMIILGLVVWYAFRVAADAEARSERLLNNVLPKKIADQLIEYPNDPIADRFDEATVLFADIVGFTSMSERLEAREIVSILNQLFSEFDIIGAEYKVEKIKTIGDAYMAVSGIPDIKEDHADRMMQMAISMLEITKSISQSCGQEFSLRIGIATGPITAGVIGKAKFAYDVWSSTVNLAARLEANGKPDRIHVSEETYRYLKNKYKFESSPSSNLKGIGRVKSWLLKK